MSFPSIRIVLVEPSHPGNIGSVARAIKTMGFRKLYLVSPGEFPHPSATAMAAGAADILGETIVTTTLQQAIEHCQLIIGTSARRRGLSLPALTPENCALLLKNKPRSLNVAILFGREQSGLTNNELLHCHYHLTIPSAGDYGVLNLAQAVQIVTYELRIKFLEPMLESSSLKNECATYAEMAQFYEHLKRVLKNVNFLKSSRSNKRLWQRILRLFNRTGLESTEITILRGILSQIEKKLGLTQASSSRQKIILTKEFRLTND